MAVRLTAGLESRAKGGHGSRPEPQSHVNVLEVNTKSEGSRKAEHYLGGL